MTKHQSTLATLSVQTMDSVGNQIVIHSKDSSVFYSYNTIIAIKSYGKPTLIFPSWDYSVTTLKYLGNFLGAGKQLIKQRLADSTYIYKGEL